MVLKVYCDTNVYLDYFLERDTVLTPHSQFAWLVFSAAYQKKIILVFSDWLEYQIKKVLGDKWELAKGLIEDLKKRGVIEEVKATPEIKREANNYPTEHEDAVHALLAIKAGAKILVTRNVRHFELFKNKIKVLRPSDFEV